MSLQWRRDNPREDGLRPGIAQRVAYAEGDRVLVTHEPRVRMDIQTAVQVSVLSEYPMGMIELLTESDPVPIAEVVWPQVAPSTIESVVTTGDRWRCALVRRARDARQTRRADGAAYERRAVNRLAMSKETRVRKRLDVIITMLAVAFVITLARVVALWLS